MEVVDQIKKVTDNVTALAIGADVDNGMTLAEVIEKYGKTPEMKAEIADLAVKMEGHFANGGNLTEALGYHWAGDEVAGTIKENVAKITA
ncbi:MAG: hypothetical protein ACI837_001979 [Crocinitomicaceae bacterium]|jgi:hypothetical protein